MSINQNNLIQFGIPPSRANIQVTLPTTPAEQVSTDLQKLGLTAGDLKPLNWREKMNLDYVKNQETCGDCWAQSSTAALSDRFMIHKDIQNLNLDPVITTQCVNVTGRGINTGCSGASPTMAGLFFEQKGVFNTGANCPTFLQSYKNKSLPSCSQIENECGRNKPTIYKAKTGSTRSLVATKGNKIDPSQTIVNMKKELLNGPFPVGYFVAKDFMMNSHKGFKWNRTNGIYINGAYNDDLDNMNINPAILSHLGNPKGKQWADIIMEGANPAAHAVELVGWGEGDAGPYGRVPYWVIKNSWGPKWNDGGYFKIAMNVPPHNHNSLLGLDIPVNAIVISSSGSKKPLGGIFGGGTTFDPDLNTGDGHGHKYPPGPNGQQSGQKKKKGLSTVEILAIIVAVLVLLGTAGWFIQSRRHKSNRHHR